MTDVRNPFGHGDLIEPDRVDELIDAMTPVISSFLDRLEPCEFTTTQFIEYLCSEPDGNAAYQDAVVRWGERNERMSKMVIHGQVIPGVLRRDRRLEWAGYVHGDEDPYAIPGLWRLGDQ